jgi:hypothetical protein
MALGVVSAALLFFAAVDADVGAVVEVRGGRAPIVPGEDPQAAALSVVTPAVGLEFTARDGVLRFQYAPRLSWVYSRNVDGSKPFVLHTGDASATLRPGGGAVITARASAETGEADYTALVQVLGRTQGALPQQLTGFTVVGGTLAYAQPVARGWQLEMQFDAVYREPILKMADPAAPPPVPVGPAENISKQRELAFTPGVSYAVSPTDTVWFRTALTHAAVSNGLRVVSVAPQASWRHFLSRTDFLRGTLGFAYAPQVGGPPSADNTTLSPIADFIWTARLYAARGITVTNTAAAGMTWYLDPVIASSSTRGMVGYSVLVLLPREWSIGGEALFATSLRKTPLPGEPDETIISGALPARYRISRNSFVEFGGRISDRAPHFNAAKFEFHQLELWAYAMVGGTFGTKR